MIPVLVAALLASASPADTIYTVDGGRIAGTVLEESPTTGATIQLPDGTVRRIDRDQISKIEFADGTVSNVQLVPPAAQVAPAPVPAAAAAPRAAAPETGPLDSVYFRGGGRARGSVMEETPTAVKIRLLDGTVQAYPADEVTKIEYADGTVSTPRAAPAAKVAEPAPAPRAKAGPAPIDTVYFLGSGRVRGTVIEEHPKTGVKVRLLDGSIHTYARDELQRIEYADGSVSRRVMSAPARPPAPAAAPLPPPAYPQQPVAVPPPVPAPFVPAPSAAPRAKAQIFPLYLSLGIGATFLSGDAAPGITMGSQFQSQQAHVSSELGLRFSPAFALGVYGEAGGGDASRTIRDQCQLQGLDCTAMTARWGFMARHTWSPLSTRPVWLSLGTGWESGGVVADHHTAGSRNADLFHYRGRELVRLGAGVDFRTNRVVALGLYGTVSAGEYDELKDQAGVTTSIDSATHTTAQVGLRLTLFP
jgi:hypothetical protein